MDMTFIIDDFEGPLDLLLHLIKENKMDLLNIRLEKIIDDYLKFIENQEKLNLAIASSYLVMASELIEMKSKMLLPRKVEEEEEDEDPKEVLIKKLVEYQRYKDVVSDLQALAEERKDFFTKIPENINEYREDIQYSSNMDLADLVDALKFFLNRKELERPLTTEVTKKEVSVAEREINIKKILKIRKKVNFVELFENYTREYIIATFLAILELAKKREITIFQGADKNIICEVYDE